MSTDRRLGFLRVDYDVVYSPLMFEIVSNLQLVVLDAGVKDYAGYYYYTALSPKFDKVEIGGIIPDYKLIITTSEGDKLETCKVEKE